SESGDALQADLTDFPEGYRAERLPPQQKQPDRDASETREEDALPNRGNSPYLTSTTRYFGKWGTPFPWPSRVGF
ncbi:hypothetical protein U1Q18_041247, partial [Sarracenia purpurea var. burkii]